MDASDEPQLPCADKMVFDTQAEAEATATTLAWQRGTTLRAYRCRYCGLWHLSSSSVSD